MWNDANKEILDILDMISKDNPAPLKCPVCGKKDAHMYMYCWGYGERGSVWTWCSHCKVSAHERLYLPDWWENTLVIDINLLGVHPDVLEEHKQFVDTYLNLLLQGINPSKSTQERMGKK